MSLGIIYKMVGSKCAWIILCFIFSLVNARTCTEKDKTIIFERPNPQDEDNCKVPFSESPLKAMYGCLTNKTCIPVVSKPDKPEEPNCIEELLCKQLIGHYILPEISFSPENKAIVFDLYTTNRLSVALGISERKDAQSELIIKCEQSKDRGKIKLAWLTTSNTNGTATVDFKNIPMIYKEQPQKIFWTGKAISCSVPLKLKFNVMQPGTNTPHAFNFIKKQYCLSIYTYSLLGNRTEVSSINRVLKCSTPKNLHFRFEPTTDQKYYATYHGITMVGTWILLIPTVNFIGRHFKKGTDVCCNVCCKCCKIRPWLFFHAFLAAFSVPLLAFAKYANMEYKKYWKNLRNNLITQHGVLGYTGMGLVCLNLILGFASKTKTDTNGAANIVAHIHSFTCELATLISAVVITISPGLPFSTVTCNVREVGIAWIVWYLSSNVLMSYQEFWIPLLLGRKEEAKAKSMSKMEAVKVLTVASGTQQDKQKDIDKEKEPPAYGRVRCISLMVFFVIAIIFALTLALMLYFPPSEPCYVGESTEYFEKVAGEVLG